MYILNISYIFLVTKSNAFTSNKKETFYLFTSSYRIDTPITTYYWLLFITTTAQQNMLNVVDQFLFNINYKILLEQYSVINCNTYVNHRTSKLSIHTKLENSDFVGQCHKKVNVISKSSNMSLRSVTRVVLSKYKLN